MSSSGLPDLPALTSAQVKELDRLASERFGVAIDWLMEAAGWHVARLCDAPTAVLCGVGNNGGDGLAAARHLHRWGRLASVSCIDPARLGTEARLELEALHRNGVHIGAAPALDGAEIVVDAMLGTGLNRPPAGRFADWIVAINNSGKRVVAVDVPSGLDADSGFAYAPCVHAHATVTFSLPKQGLLIGDGPRLAGDVWLADVGVPVEAFAELDIALPPGLFTSADLRRLEPQ
ncbi:MAG TPA: NAD(P)H-hydrate epimerase [Candidatus Dormibacteraeota bacterium]|nr:NAD(P)H-hydrate epimerase [Candidatus Dormibacteraeota bacterium]